MMQPLSTLPHSTLRAIDVLFTDVDDTLTTDGLLSAGALHAMEALRDNGVRVVPVTGRPAGWCHGLARLWPVAGVIAENGAAAYWLEGGRQRERFWIDDPHARAAQRSQLASIQAQALQHLPGLNPAKDQFMRVGDIAFDLAENTHPPESAARIDALIAFLRGRGLSTAVSSIHAHGFFGERNKRTMTEQFAHEVWGQSIASLATRAAFIGDSGNDGPMFSAFPISIGVANVVHALPQLPTPPAYVTQAAQGDGFIEFAHTLLQAKARA
jgi:HAD superfamily hydrolase (TIGR01484 family)